jgi:predicted DNA-binding ribbon-helix-helix protein
VTTNIRLSDALYQELKLEAARRRLSLAALIRERITDALAPEEAR